MTDPDQVAKNWQAMLPDPEPRQRAFELSQEEARDIVVSYVLNDLLKLEKPVTFGTDGAPTYPKIGERAKLHLYDIAGVAFVPDNKKAARFTMTGPMDLRTAVLAVRLARYLREESRWGVSTIFWGGMGFAFIDPNDRHGKGWAIDFHGAVTRYGKFDVSADWGSHMITLPNGTKKRHWPATARTYYRLDPSTLPGRFFYDVYHFMARESLDNGKAKESEIGDGSQILHPDTPYAQYREGHQDHIHCEVQRK